MSLQDFERKRMSEREKGISLMRTITNYGMGAIIIAFGFFFMFNNSETMEKRYDPVLLKMMAIICWVYGAFRVYRGYKKDYFRD
jgi:hypothetical protein